MNNSEIGKVGFSFTFLVLLIYLYYGNGLLKVPLVQPQRLNDDVNSGEDIKQFFEPSAESSLQEDGTLTRTTSNKKKTCSEPVSKFVFVKTHKTGSSTTKRLLLRFIAKSNFSKLVTAPYPHPYTGGYPGRFMCKFMMPKGSLISYAHTRFHATEMKKCFHRDTRYFTIIRNPWKNFLSAFHFFNGNYPYGPSCFGMPKAHITLGKRMNTAEFLSKANTLLSPSISFYFRFRNYQSHDLGMDPMLNDVDEIESQIKTLDKNMDLVMLLEYFDESLILLKNLLCLDWKTLFTAGGEYSRKYKPTLFPNAKEKKHFQQLYNIDLALYDHFNRTFWERVDAYGRDKMAKDLELLRQKRKKRSIWKRKYLPKNIRMNGKLERELQAYMAENSGQCFYPS